MIRYRLDDLGWYQFEWLVQSLLKAELGLGLESWGGHRDHGRDAYTASRLNFPDKHSVSEGPFTFQAKFIENANAAGSKVEPALVGAISKEAERIRQRQKLRPATEIRRYTLITNALLNPSVRERIFEIISKVVPHAEIHLLGGSDICDVLDRSVNGVASLLLMFQTRLEPNTLFYYLSVPIISRYVCRTAISLWVYIPASVRAEEV